VKRPDELPGWTYKIKPPTIDHAIYVTINNITLNEDTEHESVHPFEVFINSKDVSSFQWIATITLLISAVFRKGGSPLFLLEELKGVSDPNGGYFSSKHRKHLPSIVAEIGLVVERHFKRYGLLPSDEVSPEMKEFIAKKTEAHVAAGGTLTGATACSKCGEVAVILMDGCPTCTACGDSKCG
jgi:hypothetical protein